jgi:hypothetical protein
MTWKDLRHARVLRAVVAVVVITAALTGVASAGAAAYPQVRVAETVHIENEYYVTWKITYRCPAGSWISMAGAVSQPDPSRAGGSFAYMGSAPTELECSGHSDTFEAILSYPTGEPTGLQPGVADASFVGYFFGDGHTFGEFSHDGEVRVK